MAALTGLFDRLSETVRRDPAAVEAAWVRFQGESATHPDPIWLAPPERMRHLEEMAQSLRISVAEMNLLFSALGLVNSRD